MSAASDAPGPRFRGIAHGGDVIREMLPDRPVLMAAVTTVMGMIPLVIDPFFKAMAVTIMFGLAFATVLTLIVVPVLYAVFFRVRYPQE